MLYLASFTGSLLVAFPALFSIVNPIGGAMIYGQVTASRSPTQRHALAWRVAFYSGVVMLVALWAGATILSFFGITMEALRIAGGLVVAVQAWQMLARPEINETAKQEQANQGTEGDEIAFFPLTMPFTTGPGTISVAIALSASGPTGGMALAQYLAGASAAALGVAVSIGFAYASADRVMEFLGPGRARVFTRLSAFLLLCIGVQILLTGAHDALTSVLAGRPL